MKFSIPLKENHIAMWTWLSKHPDKEKRDWGGHTTLYRMREDGLLSNSLDDYFWYDCFACQYAINKSKGGYLSCRNCPIERWAILGKDQKCPCERDIYYEWQYSLNDAERSRLALKIAQGWKP